MQRGAGQRWRGATILFLIALVRLPSAAAWSHELAKCRFFNDTQDALNRTGSQCPNQGGTLVLSNRGIRTLTPGIFADMRAVEWLLLDSNALASIGASEFTGMSNLQKLWLQGNDLSSIDARAFSGLENLQELHLGDNKLTSESLDPAVFSGLPNLRSLFLNGNPKLECLPMEVAAHSALTRYQGPKRRCEEVLLPATTPTPLPIPANARSGDCPFEQKKITILGFELPGLQTILTFLPIVVGILVGIPLLAVIGKMLWMTKSTTPPGETAQEQTESTAPVDLDESNDVEAPDSHQAEACLDQSAVVSLIKSHPSFSELERQRRGRPLCDEDMHTRVYKKALCKGHVWVKIGVRKPDRGREINSKKLEKFFADAGKITFEDNDVEKLNRALKDSDCDTDLWTGVFKVGSLLFVGKRGVAV